MVSLKRFKDIDAWQKACEHSKAACAVTGDGAFVHDSGGAGLTGGTRFALAEHLGTLYVGAMHSEVSPWYALAGKIDRLKAFDIIRPESAIIATASTASLTLPEASIDYIFTGPPFGSNIIYSDLSIVWESRLKLATNTSQESVVHRRKKREALTLADYTRLMTACFQHMSRALKPGR